MLFWQARVCDNEEPGQMFSEPKLIDYSAVTLMKEEDVVKHPITFWVVSQEWNYPARKDCQQ